MAGITKVYPGNVVANDGVTLEAEGGAIHAIVGENGAGKSTLMNVLYGVVRPDEGRIRLHGREADIRSPGDAIGYGIGMVTQHSSQIPALSVVDNILLGRESSRAGVLTRSRAIRELEAVADDLGVSVPWQSRAATLSVAALQKAEIVRALYRGARVLILDEPSASLAPQEAEALFGLLHRLADAGHTVILVTHRLQEVMDHASRVTVLRRGRNVAELPTTATSAGELSALMVGGGVTHGAGSLVADSAGPDTPSDAPRDPWSVIQPSPGAPSRRLPVLELEHVSADETADSRGVTDVTLEVLAGEIVGVAGIDGSGQRELCEVIVGLRRPKRGRVVINGRDNTSRPVSARLREGLGFCPEDRQREGLVLDFTLAENLLLGHQDDPRSGGGVFLRPDTMEAAASSAMKLMDVRAPSPHVAARALSGGNQQKLLLARALVGGPKLLVAMQPTRGLDIHATRSAYDVIATARAGGLGVLLFSLDLDEILAVANRIVVMYAGRVAGIVERAGADRNALGHMMTTGERPE